jgi:cytosine/adenosine deaminase-related metal-dependent hydrolase
MPDTNGANGTTHTAAAAAVPAAALVANEAVKTTKSITAEQHEIERLKAKLAKFEQESLKKRKPLTFKIADKGGIQVNGLGRFPWTPYANQLMRVLQAADDLRAFTKKHFDECNFQTEAEREECRVYYGVEAE